MEVAVVFASELEGEMHAYNMKFINWHELWQFHEY